MTQLERTAYHEAGHAVANFRLRLRVGRVTIRLDSNAGTLGSCYGGRAIQRRHNVESDAGDWNRIRMERDVIVLLAGHEAEAYFSGRRNHIGARVDREGAIDLLSYFAGDFYEKSGAGKQEESRAYYRLLQIRARHLVRNRGNWEMVRAVAKRLLERETISGAEALALLRQSLEAQFNSQIPATATIDNLKRVRNAQRPPNDAQGDREVGRCRGAESDHPPRL